MANAAKANGRGILLLDDDEDLRGLLEKVLTQEGFLVRAAPDTPAALRLCEEEAPAMMIVDLMLPHMDGEAFLAEYRERWPARKTPVLLLTASAVREEVAERMDVEASLEKPFHIEDVCRIVRALCDQSE